LREAEGEIARSMEIFSVAGSQGELNEATLVAAQLAYRRGDYQSAKSLCSAVVRNLKPHQVEARISVTMLLARMGNSDVAMKALDDAMQLAEECDCVEMLWRVLGLRADALYRRGEYSRALGELEIAQRIVRRISGGLSDELHESFLATEDVRDIADRLVAWKLEIEESAAGIPETIAEVTPSLEQADVGPQSGVTRRQAQTALSILREENRNLERLVGINKDLNVAVEGRCMLELIVDTAMELTKAERGFIMLIDTGRMKAFVSRNMRREMSSGPERRCFSPTPAAPRISFPSAASACRVRALCCACRSRPGTPASAPCT
jgi:tetratricopeptide (TPR) repeat protein